MISVPLYAPSWTNTLANKASEVGPEVYVDYWKNVHIWQRPEQSQLESIVPID